MYLLQPSNDFQLSFEKCTMKVLILLGLYLAMTKLSKATEMCSKEFCIPANYSKSYPPIEDAVNLVQVLFEGIQITNVNDMESTITLNLQTSLSWIEPRIFYTNNTASGRATGVSGVAIATLDFRNCHIKLQ